MKKILVRVACGLALVWALWPTLRWMTQTEATIAIEQLRGRGCLLQESGEVSLNPLVESVTRHPEWMCPIYAAERLAGLRVGADRKAALDALAEAERRMPARFDTGDGVIEYQDRIRKAREAFAATTGDLK